MSNDFPIIGTPAAPRQLFLVTFRTRVFNRKGSGGIVDLAGEAADGTVRIWAEDAEDAIAQVKRECDTDKVPWLGLITVSPAGLFESQITNQPPRAMPQQPHRGQQQPEQRTGEQTVEAEPIAADADDATDINACSEPLSDLHSGLRLT